MDNRGVYFASDVSTIGMAASTDAVKPRRRLTFPHKLFLRFLLSHFSIGANMHGYYRLAGITRESFFAQKNPQTSNVCECDILVTGCCGAVSRIAVRCSWRHSLWRVPPLLFHSSSVETLPNPAFSGYCAAEPPTDPSAANPPNGVLVSAHSLFSPINVAEEEYPHSPIPATAIL